MIYVYTESNNRKYTKASLEAVSYAKSLAILAQDSICALSINTDDPETLYKYGAEKVIVIENEVLNNFSANVYANLVSELMQDEYLVFPHSNEASSVAGLVTIKKSAAIITNVVETPTSLIPFTVKRKAFSGKGKMIATTTQAKVILTVVQNSYGIKENPVAGTLENVTKPLSQANTKVENIEKTTGKLNLIEAEIVVSAGRGMKGPENWGMIEEMATLLGAATACSKPVSDMGWRPHSEHVGQTGKAIAPNLYIAIGISGAIQHLAGVNGSKTIVVINADADAPFFKSADYGIVGDAFDIVPKLNIAIKAFKGN